MRLAIQHALRLGPRNNSSAPPPEFRVYLCPSALFKLHPAFDHALLSILRKDKLAYFMIMGDRKVWWTNALLNRFADKAMNENLTWSSFEEEETKEEEGGTKKMGKREKIRLLLDTHFVFFSPPRESSSSGGGGNSSSSPGDSNEHPHGERDRMVGLLEAVDVVLDAFPISGYVTTLQALSVGTPVVTLPSNFLGGRLTLAMYQAMGIAPPPAPLAGAAGGGANDDDAGGEGGNDAGDDEDNNRSLRDRRDHKQPSSLSSSSSSSSSLLSQLVATDSDDFVAKAMALSSAPLRDRIELRTQLLAKSTALFEDGAVQKQQKQQQQQRKNDDSSSSSSTGHGGGGGAVAQWDAFLTRVADEHPRAELLSGAATAAFATAADHF